jgi:DNA-binding NarL/FixJ family response regulator
MKEHLPCRIAIADDHAMLRRTIRVLLESHQYLVVAEAANGSELIEKIDPAALPDICIIDLNMPVVDGLTATAYIKKHWPSIKVLIYSLNDYQWYQHKARAIGADVYMSKHESIDHLLTVLKELCDH